MNALLIALGFWSVYVLADVLAGMVGRRRRGTFLGDAIDVDAVRRGLADSCEPRAVSDDYADALLPAGWTGPVVSWKDEGRFGPVFAYDTAEEFRLSLKPRAFGAAVPFGRDLGWTRAEARRIARERGAAFVEF
jgi:hypothetical protein